MLLQEIFTPEYNKLTEIYGLEINSESSATEYSRPPENFETIGFKLVLDDDNLIDETLLDIIINYKLTNMTIVVEVPSQILSQGKMSPKDLILLSSNVDFSISLLPPNHPFVNNEITNEEYIQVVKNFNDEMLKKQNYDKFVAPITNFLEYLMLESLLGEDNPIVKNFIPDNEYVKSTFAEYMTVEQSNEFKDILRQSLYDFYGSKEEFNAVAQEIFKGVYNKSQEIFSQHVQNYISENNSSSNKM